MEAGLFPINEPDESSLVIVSGNNRLTFEVLATIWAQGVTPAYFLLVDCLGNTVDMAMVYGEFTAMRLAQMLGTSGLESKVKHRRMIVPGWTAPLANEFAAATNWEVEVGPVCAVELPLFLGERWLFSNRRK
jgi:acetyl-CoA decarbonylase/synthase complex subunit gamma